MEKYETIDEYISNFSGETKEKLATIRETIHEVAPKATEKISYGIPTFYLNGNLVHFAGYKTHIGFYPGSEHITEFKNELSTYKTSKGTVQFPIDSPLPIELIQNITIACVERNLSKPPKK